MCIRDRYLKRRYSSSALERAGGIVCGEPPTADVVQVHENRLTFELRLTHEEHVGLWLDTRPARRLIQRVSQGRRVLNLFSHSCGFGMAACVGGAVLAENVDNKAGCLRMGATNYTASGLPIDERKSFRKADAVGLLRDLKSAGPRAEMHALLYDLVILDPPPNFHQHSCVNFVAKNDYALLLADCLRVTNPGGGSLVLAGLNALAVSDAQLEEMVAEAVSMAGVNAKVVEHVKHGKDFEPACPHRPTARFYLLECLE
eukprot:TRINITY_DN23737_c0_g1_i1.p1 TRINITY_DN23737_c0_g1~~TRINITY_DN23737_c0_g1_i1.p1  ORF type:complete len:258 (+),score=63.08 TRINITY_DN23737_c0_g1_i1:197-970(+)